MKILMVMDPGIPVPPLLYGGHERLVHMFAHEYSMLGHEVSLLAGPSSAISGKVISFGRNGLKKSALQRTKELIFVWKYLLLNQHKYHLIHNFGRLAYLLPILNKKIKKLMTYGRPVSRKGIVMVDKLPNKNLFFTACSNYCVSTGNVAGNWTTVYNAINFSKYKLQEKFVSDAPLIFLGRLDKVKGVHTAINIAKATGKKLLIGGNIPETKDNLEYFKLNIEPFFDNKQIQYLGPLTDEEKNFYLGVSSVLLFPIEWEEPFGMVMIESMACGTPVIAFNRGAVGEIITEGKTGYIVHDFNEMLQAVNLVQKINRAQCRKIAEDRFDVRVITQNYLSLIC